MSEGSVSTKARPKIKCVVEFGDDYGRDIVINSLVGIVCRGEFNLLRMHNRVDESNGPRSGRPLGGKSPTDSMKGMPHEIPGHRMAIDTQASTATIFDPLADDEFAGLIERLEHSLQNGLKLGSDGKLGFIKPQRHELNDDQMKTLLLEIRQKIAEKSAKVISGSLPDEDVIRDSYPGRELYDPRSQAVGSRRPRYKDEVDTWEQGLERARSMSG